VTIGAIWNCGTPHIHKSAASITASTFNGTARVTYRPASARVMHQPSEHIHGFEPRAVTGPDVDENPLAAQLECVRDEVAVPAAFASRLAH